ncbi:MAG: hypothetical protein ACO3XI_17855 [bacterium]|jgi:hypothetical protein
MMLSRKLLILILLALCPILALAHSPWGQYQVYRQKHLLVLSTRDDLQSYPYSKKLVEALNKSVPESKARPARAINLERAYNLLRTNQFQFALLSKANIEMMRNASDQFQGKNKVDLKTIYEFGDLEFVVQPDFPEDLVAVVAHGVLESLESLPEAKPTEEVIANNMLHAGARKALTAN